MKKDWPNLLALAFFTCVLGIFFAPVFKGLLPTPADDLVGLYHPWRDLYAQNYPRGIPFKNALITDPVRQIIPWKKLAVDEISKGHLPGWNPYNFSGTSLIGNIQAGSLYPLNLILLLPNFNLGWTLFIILEPLLGSLFLYLYLRTQKLDPLASIFGSLVWAFSGFNIAWLTWGTITHVALWLPLSLLAIFKIFDTQTAIESRKSIFYVVVLFSSLLMQLLAGHPQISLYYLVICIAYVLFQFKESTKLSNRNILISKCALIASCFGLALLVASLQWKPFWDVLSQSGRNHDISSWKNEGWFLPWHNLIQFIVPDFFGNPSTLNYWGVWNYGEFIGYVGISALILSFFSLASKRKEVLFWSGSVTVGLILMLPSQISKLPFQLSMPILASLQPTRYMFIVDFSISILAAYGFQHWLSGKDSKKLLSIVTLLLIVFGVLWLFVIVKIRSLGVEAFNFDISKRNLLFPSILFLTYLALLLTFYRSKSKQWGLVVGMFLICLTTLDLFRFGRKFTPFVSGKYFFPSTQSISFLQKQPRPFRIYNLDKRVFPPNSASYYKIESTDGYDPIFSKRYEELLAASEREAPNTSLPSGFNRIISLSKLHTPVTPLLSAKYIVSLDEIQDPSLKFVFKEGETRIYENTEAWPRFRFVNDVKRVSDKQKVITEIFSGLDLKQVAIVEENVPVKAARLNSSDSVIVNNYGDNNIDLASTLGEPHFLLILNAYDSRWKAYLDQNLVKIYIADYSFQGIIVPAGKHTIHLEYAPYQ